MAGQTCSKKNNQLDADKNPNKSDQDGLKQPLSGLGLGLIRSYQIFPPFPRSIKHLLFLFGSGFAGSGEQVN
jgi:hypothetical protein